MADEHSGGVHSADHRFVEDVVAGAVELGDMASASHRPSIAEDHAHLRRVALRVGLIAVARSTLVLDKDRRKAAVVDEAALLVSQTRSHA